MRGKSVLVAPLLALQFGFALPAAADHGPDHGFVNGGGNGEETTEVDVSPGAVQVSAGFRSELMLVGEPTYRPGRAIGCFYFMVTNSYPWVIEFDRATAIVLYEASDDGERNPVGIYCWYLDDNSSVPGYPTPWTPPPYDPPTSGPPLITEHEVEDYVREQLTFDPPSPELSPTGDQVVGVRTWLAVTSQLDYAPLTAEAGPVWVTATPVFSHVDWTLGNGDRVRCTGAVDTLWDPDLDDDEQDSSCTYVYESNGEGDQVEMFVTAEAVWSIEITRSSGVPSGPFTASTATTVAVNVRELQAVID